MATTRPSTNEFAALVKQYRTQHKLTQLMLAACGNCDHSIVSKIESGKHVPPIGTAEAFADAFVLKGAEREYFFAALRKALLQRQGMDTEAGFFKADEIIGLADNSLAEIRLLRQSGMPRLAVALGENRIQLLKPICDRNQMSPMVTKLLRQLSLILIETGKSYMDFLNKTEVWGYMSPIIIMLGEIAERLKDPSISLLADINEESAYYVSRDYQAAYRKGHEIFKQIHLLDADWKLEALRASVINAGNLGKPDEVHYYAQLISQWKSEEVITNPFSLTFMLEGLARAQANLGDHTALGTIQEAVAVFDNTADHYSHSPLKKVQLIRSELKVAEALQIKDYQRIESIGKAALMLCRSLGYDRHAAEIQSSLERILNQKT